MPTQQEEWREGTKQKLLEQLDFLSDHWVKGDDRPPFSFGGWREEVAESFIEIIRKLLSHQQEEMKESLRKKIEGMKKLSIKTLSEKGVEDSAGYYHALQDILSTLKE